MKCGHLESDWWVKNLYKVIEWSVGIFSINTTSDISKLLYVISRAVRWVKFEIILKYCKWYLRQISCYYLFILLPPWLRTFFLKSPEMEFFSPTYNIVRLSALRDIFFRAGYFFPRYFLARIFFLSNQCAGDFFLKSPIPTPQPPPAKVKCLAPWEIIIVGNIVNDLL